MMDALRLGLSIRRLKNYLTSTNNPQAMNTKYENIQFGQFQGIINYCEASSKLSVLSNKVDNSLKRVGEKLQQAKKTMRDLCSVITYNDCELGELVVFYRVADICDNPQTDNSSDGYVIECVTLDDEEIKFSGKLEEEILSYLNCQNPKGLKFPDVNSHAQIFHNQNLKP